MLLSSLVSQRNLDLVSDDLVRPEILGFTGPEFLHASLAYKLEGVSIKAKETVKSSCGYEVR